MSSHIKRGLLFLSLFCLLSWFFKEPVQNFKRGRKEFTPSHLLWPRTVPEQILLGFHLDINRLSKSDFEQLPHVGPSLAENIVAYRERFGPFKQLEELLSVSGFGPKTYANLKPFLKSPLSPF